MILSTGIAILFLLTLSGFFSGSETALTAASRARMHALEQEGDKRANRVNKLLADKEGLIGAILLGNNLVNILASALATTLFAALFPGALGVAIATAVMTVLVLVFAEVLPKTYAISRPDQVAMKVARPISLVVKAVGWIIVGIQAIVTATLRIFGVDAKGEMVTADEEIRGAIDLHHMEGGVPARQRHRLVGAMDISDMTVEEVMVHRKNLDMLNADQPPGQFVKRALKSAHTRIPVYRGDQEEIIGIIHAKDLLRAALPLNGEFDRLDIDNLMREPWFIPETTPLEDQLQNFLNSRSHFALVIDEYGTLQGLVTLEDILEEIVGDIRDEHDTVVEGVKKVGNRVEVSGWVTIRDLNRATGWRLPDEEAVTVAGLVIHEAQAIPEEGQSFVFHDYRFDVTKRKRNQVTGLVVRPCEDITASD